MNVKFDKKLLIFFLARVIFELKHNINVAFRARGGVRAKRFTYESLYERSYYEKTRNTNSNDNIGLIITSSCRL